MSLRRTERDSMVCGMFGRGLLIDVSNKGLDFNSNQQRTRALEET